MIFLSRISFIKKTIRDNHLGECFEEAEKTCDYDKMKLFISNLYTQKITSGKVSQNNSSEIKNLFSAEYMTNKFKELI